MERVTACHGVLSRRSFSVDGRARARSWKCAVWNWRLKEGINAESGKLYAGGELYKQRFLSPVITGSDIVFTLSRGLGLRVSLSLACYALTGRAPCWRTARSTPSLLVCHPLKRVLNSARLWLADC